jgi:hypothetical protein
LEPVENKLRLSEIDRRLPDVIILNDRYFEGRPDKADVRTSAWTAVNSTPTDSTSTAWVCPCEIAGIVYNRSSSSECGYCGGKESKRTERTADWDFLSKKEDSNAWYLERLDVDEVKPFSDKHKLPLPTRVTGKMGGLPKEKSGVLFVILMALGFDHDTSYRTAAQPVRWGFGGATKKLAEVIQLLIDSDELAEITATTNQMYKV